VPTEEPSLAEAMGRQADACESLGSPQYASLIRRLRADLEVGGLTHRLLSGRSDSPLRDAITLRLLGAVHRIVLRGDSPELALRYRSAGGDGSSIDPELFLATAMQFEAEILEGLHQNVQTNEVGRCAALVPAFALVARETGLPLSMLEVGASGGLISNWDRYRYECHGSALGPADSTVRFTDRWTDEFDLSGDLNVAARNACDVAPLDVTTPEDRLRLLSFVWPDQEQRFSLLTAALDLAQRYPPVVQRADAGDWLADNLPARAPGTATIVFHSIVWQYLPRPTKERLREVLKHQGSSATSQRPIAWVRLEPAGTHADVRVTTWPGGLERTVALSSYHGSDVRVSP